MMAQANMAQRTMRMVILIHNLLHRPNRGFRVSGRHEVMSSSYSSRVGNVVGGDTEEILLAKLLISCGLGPSLGSWLVQMSEAK